MKPADVVIDDAEVYVRTTHLLLKLEEAQQQIAHSMGGKAVVFGSLAEISALDVA